MKQEPKINDMTDQRLIQTEIKPTKFQATRAWNKLRLQLEPSIPFKLLDNYFKDEKK